MASRSPKERSALIKKKLLSRPADNQESQGMYSIHGARTQAACWLLAEDAVHQVSPERERIERKKGSIWSPGLRGLFLNERKGKGGRRGRHHRPSRSHLLSEDVRGPATARGGGKARWPSGGLFSASLYTTWKRDGPGSTCGRGPSLCPPGPSPRGPACSQHFSGDR